MTRVMSGTTRMGRRERKEVNVYFHNGMNEVMPKWQFMELLERAKPSIRTYKYC